MSRNVDPVPQYLDSSGLPLAGGLMYYYDSGTTTLKNTYSDSAESIANTNPVVLDAAGRLPSVFYSGAARQVLKTSADVQLWERDPVSSIDAASFGASWDSLTVFSVNAVVSYNDKLYVSIANTNQNNIPASDATNWTRFDLVKRWNTNETYDVRDPVIGTDATIYLSVTSNNQGNDPTTDGGSNWAASGAGAGGSFSFNDWDNSKTYGVGGSAIVKGSDGEYYVSIQGSNLNKDPISQPTYWSRVELVNIWNANQSYSINDIVTLNGINYVSLTNSNQGNNPLADFTNWTSRITNIVPTATGATVTGKITSDTDASADEDYVRKGQADTLYEPVFSKETGFNKAFGSGSGTVCEGDDSRLSDARTPTSHTHTESEITDLDKYTQTEVDALVAGLSADIANSPGAFSGTLVYLGSDFTVPSGSLTEVEYDTEDYDTDSIHSTVTNPERLTVPSGYAYAKISARITSSATMTVIMRKNGSTYAGETYGGTGSGQNVFHSGWAKVVAGDYFTVQLLQTSGSNATLPAANFGNWFSMELKQ